MKKIGLIIIYMMCSLSIAWAGDETPTTFSNKAAIDLVQSHAEYVWTLDATEHGGNAYPDFSTINHGTMGVSSGSGNLKFKYTPSFEFENLVSQI